MQPIMFTMDGVNRCLFSGSKIGVPPPLLCKLPFMQPVYFTITGITKDSSGAILGSCTVQLFRTLDDSFVEEVISDATTGAYTVHGVGMSQQYYLVAYKAGSPDVAGTTVNTLIGTAS